MTLCLMTPGVCTNTGLDHLSQVTPQHQAGPVERWRPLVESQFPATEVDTAMCIIRHESNGDPEADNPRSSARGLFQILGSLWGPKYGVTQSELDNALLNTRIARDIWDRQGWWAWSPYRRGSCRGMSASGDPAADLTMSVGQDRGPMALI